MVIFASLILGEVEKFGIFQENIYIDRNIKIYRRLIDQSIGDQLPFKDEYRSH